MREEQEKRVIVVNDGSLDYTPQWQEGGKELEDLLLKLRAEIKIREVKPKENDQS